MVGGDEGAKNEKVIQPKRPPEVACTPYGATYGSPMGGTYETNFTRFEKFRH